MFSHATKSSRIDQDVLVKQLAAIFPNEKPIVNARKETNIKNETENYFLELDVWFPKQKIGFEFQDEYHYTSTWYSHNYLAQIQTRDNIKKDSVKQTGITLIEVPYWWNGDTQCLLSAIHFYRPDLIDHDLGNAPMPLNPPQNFLNKQQEIPDVGELMYAAFPTLPSRFDMSLWWIGEKYDGIRFCWNPNEFSAYSRNGTKFSLLSGVLSNFSSVFIDGEFWFGRGMFPLTHTLVNKLNDLVLWDQFRTVAFDTPFFGIQNKPFEERYSHLVTGIPVSHQFIILASRMYGSATFEHLSQMIIDDEGEGVIARKRGSLYEHGRSLALLKFKKVYGDREGVIVDIQNRTVKLLVPEGVTISVPPEDVFISNVGIGDVVTFSYERAARTNLPSQVKIHRLRKDISWEYVVDLFHKEKRTYDVTEDTTAGNMLDNKTMRIFLEDYVKQKGLDPLTEDTWYNLNCTELNQNTRARAILRRHKGYISTLQVLFPELRLDITCFNNALPIWGDIKNRKQFFLNFAREHGFNPLIPDGWYKHSNRSLFGKQIKGIEKYHKNSVTQALLDLFPEIGLDRVMLQSSWKDPANRRLFFENYARANGFDPLDPQAWQAQPIKKIKAHKRVRSILTYYGNNFSMALSEIFPEIGWKITSYGTWSDISKRRQFFEGYAKQQGFDPLIAENWYCQSIKHMKTMPGVRSIIFYHGYSVARALHDLFPDIGLVMAKCNRIQNKISLRLVK